jgi:hypothetical protein
VEEQLAFAASVRRTLFTQNVRDYRMLHFAWAAASRGHGGIVAPGDQRASIGDQIRALGQLDAMESDVGLANRFFYYRM